MPRFFFDIYNDIMTQDGEGIDLEDDAAALSRARVEAQNLAAESIREYGHLILSHQVLVRDETGRTIGQVRFDEAVDIRHSD